MSCQSTYVYGLIRAEDHGPISAPAVGDPNQPVILVGCGRIAALVSAIDQLEIMPARRHMLAHTKVLEAAMADRPVLPMRFGIIVPSPGTLLQAVGPRSQELRVLLDRVDGRIEVALKASWDEQMMWREVADEHPRLAVSGRALVSGDQQRAYYDRIDLGRAIGAALEEKRATERQRLLDIVKPFAVEVKDLGPIDDAMFAHFALLVDKSAEPALYDTIAALERSQSSRLTFRYVAPIPPYNFVTVNLDWNQRQPAMS